jgi:hypothetical protein
MDFVHNLTAELNNQLGTGIFSSGDIVKALSAAADRTVKDGLAGKEFADALNRPQLGLLLLALQWNATPQIRQAVRR